jgi:hypothetical protein
MKKEADSRILFINAFSYIILAFVSVFMLSELFTAMVSSFFDIPTILKKDGIQFLADEEDWWYDSVTIIFLSKPFFLLFTGLITYIIYLKTAVFTGYLKLYFMWYSFLSLLLFNGEILYGSLLNESMSFVFAWLYVNDTMRLFFLVLTLLIYVVLALMFSKAFIFSGNVYFQQYNEVRLKQIFLYHLLIPYSVAVVVLFLAFLPAIYLRIILSLATGIPLFIIILFNSSSHAQFMRMEEAPKPATLDHKAFLTAIFALIFSIVALTYGIRIT